MRLAEPTLPSMHAMPAIIADAYQVFGRHPAPSLPLDACPCCMDPELQEDLRKLPLSQLSRHYFSEYNSAAKGEVQPVSEVLYFLPRLLELVAHGEEVHHSIELYLNRIGRCPQTTFNESEQAILDRFALTYFADHLASLEHRVLKDAMSVLLMFHIGGLRLEPLLDYWLNCQDPRSTIHYVETCYWDFLEGREVSNPFADDLPDFRQTIAQWMLAPAHRAVFANKLMQPTFLRLVDQKPKSMSMSFRVVVDAVSAFLSE